MYVLHVTNIPMKSIADPTPLPVKTILIAEDDVDDQDFITEALLQIDNSFTIQTVLNGTHVLTYLEKLSDTQMPQLIILDYHLPELDGADVLQLLTQNPRYAPIPKIVWSNSNSPHYKNRSLEQGAALYMVKPSTITAIEDLARQMLGFCKATA